MTIEECQAKIAREAGYENWRHLQSSEGFDDEFWEDVCELYAYEKVKEQRSLMAVYMQTHFNMRNVPKPKIGGKVNRRST